MTPATSDIMGRAAARLKELPIDNPAWGSDALLIVADALLSDAAELCLHDGPLGRVSREVLITAMRRLAARAQAMAPAAATTTTVSAARDLLRRESAV
jgi:hypothetical protein